MAIDEQLLAQQSGEIGQAPAEAGTQLQVLEQEQCDQGGPDLNLQGIGAGTDEGLDAEILFERLEEQLSGKGLARYQGSSPVSFPAPPHKNCS